MFDNKNQNVSGINTIITSYEVILNQLRQKEKEYLLKKRREEYDRIRPPKDKWWELKSHHFTEEELRNRMLMKATPKYYDKIEKLQDSDFY